MFTYVTNLGALGTIIKDFGPVATVLAALVAALGTLIIWYLQHRSRRARMLAIRQTFDAVIKSLASGVEVERLAGAILLRRFFDPDSEMGTRGWLRRFLRSGARRCTPYCKEAVDAAAAILRGQETGNFQKLLADGLGFAPTLERADLQRTNLQFAYLGKRTEKDPSIKLNHADFYRADLSMASLKGAKARGAFFYQARMHNTILRGADLQGANFYDADLRGANFRDTILTGANFSGARNVPPEIRAKLDQDGVYHDKPVAQPARDGKPPARIPVFVSKPGCLDYEQRQHLEILRSKLAGEDMEPVSLERPDYPNFGTLAEVQRLIDQCAGMIVFGFKQLEVNDGWWRKGTPERRRVNGLCLASSWNQIETGMAAMKGLPILVICERGVTGGVFDPNASGPRVYHVFSDENWATTVESSFDSWCADIREWARSQLA